MASYKKKFDDKYFKWKYSLRYIFNAFFLLVKISLNGTYYYITDTIGIVLT